MIKYYDILQVKNIKDSINYLADKIGMDRRDLADILDVGSIQEIIDFIDYCKDRHYSANRIIANKLNRIARYHDLTIRFVPEDETFK